MLPVIVLDSTALHGRNSLAGANVTLLLALAKIGEIRLVVPEVVLLELSRQWAEEVESATAGIGRSVGKLNAALRDVGHEPLVVDVTSLDRSVFYDHVSAHLMGKRVEIIPPPQVSVVDLMHKDLDVRKPFVRTGKGFRDALTWETIKQLCSGLADPANLVVFVTDNHTDFCIKENGPLHPDLRAELHPSQRFDVLPSIKALLEHTELDLIVKRFRVLEETFTPTRLLELIDFALSELVGQEVSDALGVYEGDGLYSVPINVGLDGAAFDEIMIDENSIQSDIYRVGKDLTIRVTVETECSFDGFIDKSDYFVSDDEDGLSLLEDWNDHVFRAGARREVRFTLNGSFTEDTLDTLSLTVDDAVEI
ncbi:PIN domain-containing protein [Microbacterium sp. NPDC055988]|uniref:PIN domain-containing protein n=1 Tax=Microbacterium sp. NPDC055988 TaxID=3345671 RepID=UPI0035D7B4D1